MTCRHPDHRFVVQWRAHSAGRWRIEQTFWTRDDAQRFHDQVIAESWNVSYQWRVAERGTRRRRAA